MLVVATPAKSESTSSIKTGKSAKNTNNSISFTHQSPLITFIQKSQPVQPITNIPHVNEIEHPFTSAKLLVQSTVVPTTLTREIVQVTNVKANRTSKGVELILQTIKGQQLPITNRSSGNNFIADLPNAQLRLPNGQAFIFVSNKPIRGITQIRVNNLDASTIRVTVVGEASAPAVELFYSPREGLIFSFAFSAPAAQQGQQPQTPPPSQAVKPVPPGGQQLPSAPSNQATPEVVVTGEKTNGYSVPDASTATRTDTPLRDIPQSIQVVPQQVLKDQQVIRASDALRNVSGVQRTGTGGQINESFTIRGFTQYGANLRDGFRDSSYGLVETANLERIEVLKGPASVLYGNVDPGGIVNFVTKKPLENPFYSFGVQAGSFGLVRPTLDISGPLISERALLYRLNAVYQHGGWFREFDQKIERFLVSPVLSWKIDQRTSLILEFEHLDDQRPFDRGLVAFGKGIADIPYERVLQERYDYFSRKQDRAGYRLEHSFSSDWKLRSRFQFSSSDNQSFDTERNRLNERTGELSRTWYDSNDDFKEYVLQNELVGKFSTDWVKHTLLFGVDLDRTTDYNALHYGPAPSINIFNPVYGTVPRPSRNQLPNVLTLPTETNSFGIFLQDQLALSDNLKLLLGGRFDLVDQKSTSDQQDDAFTPRVGIVYQPIQLISLYASFSQSFQPNSGTRSDGSLLPPQRGTQYEVGVKGEFLNNRLTATLAAYQITKSNVATTDPNNSNFVVPVGEQRSRGIELDVAGSILPGWNIIASYAYTDAKVTRSNDGQQGNQLNNAPFNAASLWTTYQIQTGSLKGLGFGLGLFYTGERQGDLANDFKLDSYLRTDASIFYQRNNWRLRLNFNNLFNVNYIEASETRFRVDPGAPFNVQGTISFTF